MVARPRRARRRRGAGHRARRGRSTTGRSACTRCAGCCRRAGCATSAPSTCSSATARRCTAPTSPRWATAIDRSRRDTPRLLLKLPALLKAARARPRAPLGSPPVLTRPGRATSPLGDSTVGGAHGPLSRRARLPRLGRPARRAPGRRGARRCCTPTSPCAASSPARSARSSSTPALALAPDLCTVSGGLNDVLRRHCDLDVVAGHVEAIVGALRGAGATVLFFTYPNRVPSSPIARPARDRVAAFNAALARDRRAPRTRCSSTSSADPVGTRPAPLAPRPAARQQRGARAHRRRDRPRARRCPAPTRRWDAAAPAGARRVAPPPRAGRRPRLGPRPPRAVGRCAACAASPRATAASPSAPTCRPSCPPRPGALNP